MFFVVINSISLFKIGILLDHIISRIGINSHHLRIWSTNSLHKIGSYIYVGMANAVDGLKWGIIPQISPDLDTERELLYQDLKSIGIIDSHLKMQLVKPLIGKNFMGEQFFTDGKLYIITF